MPDFSFELVSIRSPSHITFKNMTYIHSKNKYIMQEAHEQHTSIIHMAVQCSSYEI